MQGTFQRGFSLLLVRSIDAMDVMPCTRIMDSRFEELKRELFNWGTDYIEEFLGFEIDSNWEKDTIDNAMDEVYEQMPADELEIFYQKFNVKSEGSPTSISGGMNRQKGE